MNKRYKVEEDGQVKVETTEGHLNDFEDKYTKNTSDILSLQNVVERLSVKKGYLERNLKQLKEEKQKIKKDMLGILITIILFFAMIVLPGIIRNIMTATMIKAVVASFSIITISFEIPETIRLIKNNHEIEKYPQRIAEVTHKVNKLNKRIAKLFEDKTPIKPEEVDQFTEVKSIDNFNFDVQDYFIERYSVDKRTKQIAHPKKKVRKLTKETNEIYKF